MMDKLRQAILQILQPFETWKECLLEIKSLDIEMKIPLSIPNVPNVPYDPYASKTMLMYFMFILPYTHLSNEDAQQKIKLLIEAGSDINQVIDEKTALSYLVKSNRVDLVRWCIESYDVDLSLGNLLIESSNRVTEEQYQIVKQEWNQLYESS